MRLGAVRLFVTDLGRATAFYEERLGLPVRVREERSGFVVLDGGAAPIVLETVPDSAPAEDRELVGRFTGISFEVDDLGATHERLVAEGVAFASAPERQDWGGRLATFADPDGNRLQLVEMPRRGGPPAGLPA